MKAKAKKKTFNIIMVALICVMVACGLMGVGTMKGWFGDGGKSEIVETETVGQDKVEKSETVNVDEGYGTGDEGGDVAENLEKKLATNNSGSESSGEKVKTCTIQIQCKSILGNMDNLKEGKNKYVPSNGIILATSRIEFNEGDTAYDVTKWACSATGIQIEAAYTPAYGSYYVEGINHLYEFDCGEMSGWMYKVNGWAPNYGCSEYKLKDGDNIVWYYTCTGK